MPRPKIDKQTRKAIIDGDELTAMVRSPGWRIARRRLMERVTAVGNILDIRDKENALVELAARQMCVEILLDWLMDIEGSVTQHKTNVEAFREAQQEEIIERFEETEAED